MIGKVYKSKNKPIAAYATTLSGGIFILLGGLVSLAFAFAANRFIGFWPFLIGGYATAILGIIAGVVVITSAFNFDSKNVKMTEEWGTVALIFGVLSIFDLGGFFVGFILVLIGSLIAICKKN